MPKASQAERQARSASVGSFTSVKEAAENASDCRGATPERVPILHS
jgi:hypothetical protein